MRKPVKKPTMKLTELLLKKGWPSPEMVEKMAKLTPEQRECVLRQTAKTLGEDYRKRRAAQNS